HCCPARRGGGFSGGLRGLRRARRYRAQAGGPPRPAPRQVSPSFRAALAHPRRRTARTRLSPLNLLGGETDGRLSTLDQSSYGQAFGGGCWDVGQVICDEMWQE